MLTTLEARGIPAVAVTARSPGPRRSPELPTVGLDSAPFLVNLCYVSGDGMRGLIRQAGGLLFPRRYSIGVWWWEVAPAPARWANAARYLEEIWVSSDHVRGAIAPVVPIPVAKLPQAVPEPRTTAVTRQELGLPDGFVFYSAFDHASGFARKNPLGLVEAFRRAFTDGSGPQLVIRSINARHEPANHTDLRRGAAGRSDIHIQDRYLATELKNAMLSHCDCYVSLHRAEGFGLPLAEAMRLGKPVVATAWSGNLEFMTPSNSYLVRHTMSQVGPGSWPYPARGKWAEPDIDDAARLLRTVFEDPESAAARGQRAARDLAQRHDPRCVGAVVDARLSDIQRRIL
ncbi:MAG TPA: glycosyltransferase [Chloroflexota bacterium]|nr:glycosyltransferase [Chloroflexota bacterium]